MLLLLRGNGSLSIEIKFVNDFFDSYPFNDSSSSRLLGWWIDLGERAIVIDIIVERKKSTHNENNGNAHTKIKEVENHIRKKSTSLWLLAKFGSFAIFRELDFNWFRWEGIFMMDWEVLCYENWEWKSFTGFLSFK